MASLAVQLVVTVLALTVVVVVWALSCWAEVYTFSTHLEEDRNMIAARVIAQALVEPVSRCSSIDSLLPTDVTSSCNWVAIFNNVACFTVSWARVA